jgi:hypothetical protein
VIELLKVHGTKQHSIKYALKLIDAIFIDKQDLQNIDVKKADEDPRIKAIQSTTHPYLSLRYPLLIVLDAVKYKFNFSNDEMTIIWPPIHDSILSKRRNQQKRMNLTTTSGKPSKMF